MNIKDSKLWVIVCKLDGKMQKYIYCSKENRMLDEKGNEVLKEKILDYWGIPDDILI